MFESTDAIIMDDILCSGPVDYRFYQGHLTSIKVISHRNFELVGFDEADSRVKLLCQNYPVRFCIGIPLLSSPMFAPQISLLEEEMYSLNKGCKIPHFFFTDNNISILLQMV